MSDLDLGLLERLSAAAAAFPEPWSATAGWLEDGGQAAWCRQHHLSEEDCTGDASDEEEHRAEKDAAFVEALSPSVALKLIADAKRLRELERKALRVTRELDSELAEHRSLLAFLRMNAEDPVQQAKELGWSPEGKAT